MQLWTHSCITVVGRIKDKEISCLIDSGSSGKFISQEMIGKLNLWWDQISERRLTLGEGDSAVKMIDLTKIQFNLLGKEFEIEFGILNSKYDKAVLGMPFLKLSLGLHKRNRIIKQKP